jgi:hypothetical protein
MATFIFIEMKITMGREIEPYHAWLPRPPPLMSIYVYILESIVLKCYPKCIYAKNLERPNICLVTN